MVELSKALKEGKIVISNNNDSITLSPEENIELELEAEIKKGKEGISIELSWKREVIQDIGTVKFSIGSEEPK